MSIKIEPSSSLGFCFVSSSFLSKDRDEYYYRFRQNPKQTYRCLTTEEIASLEQNGNVCHDWQNVLVEDPFLPHLVKNNFFAGLVRIGAMEDVVLKYHDFAVCAGLTNSVIISSDIGSCVAVHFCSYISHYIIEDNVILSRVDELSTTDHAKFGEGIVKEGEDESVRVKIAVINESGGREVFPFRKMLTPDAYIWAKYRGDATLIQKLEEITQKECDARRGYYGIISYGSVIKSCRIIKDVYVGEYSYIKGANKLKNLSILSSEDEPSQIGEGVELVNGIVGCASHIFYGVKAVRFVTGSHCTLKYGARLINSILGDNSTISCCEVLNSLIFPFHEQHHNNSFLIASMVMGQSNMAAGATIGSNHNTRGNDGEIIAGRGFWPGLSTTLKHNCKFASFVLLSKGSYQYELNIEFPFSLVIDNEKEGVLEIMPAYYWMYNMYALERNAKKFIARDKRVDKSLKIESDYLAPDTAYEMLKAIDTLKEILTNVERQDIVFKDEMPDIVYTNSQYIEKSKRKIKIVKIQKAINSYRQMLVYYAIKVLCTYFEANRLDFPSFLVKYATHLSKLKAPDEWVNVGGFLMPRVDFQSLIEKIKNSSLSSWDEIHNEYMKVSKIIEEKKVLHAYCVLISLGGNESSNISKITWNDFIDEAMNIRQYMERKVFVTKQKDYNSFFRKMNYDTCEEMDAVLDKLEDNSVIKNASIITKEMLALFRKYKTLW